MRTAAANQPSAVTATDVRLGLRENWRQFSLLVLVNAFVGGMVGLERSILPAIAQEEFGIAARASILSFIVAFGVTKAVANYLAGRLADRFGRKHVLVAGWLVAAPVPLLLMYAPSWNWVVAANVFLGVSQGLTWSVTVIMKIDLAGPRQRGLAMGLNEFAGYVAVAGSALATAWIAATIRSAPGAVLPRHRVRGRRPHAFRFRGPRDASPRCPRSTLSGSAEALPTQAEVFRRTTFTDRNLSSVSQAGLVNNLNDGMAWGLFPLWFAARQMNLEEIGILAAVYPATWGFAQLITGAWSDRVGRKWLIAYGMWVQAVGIAVVLVSHRMAEAVIGAVLLGIGTAMVYPTLLAAIGDVTHPSWRASSVGVYRLWRDLGYAVGAVLSGVLADALGLAPAIAAVAVVTFASGLLVAIRMRETLPDRVSKSTSGAARRS